MAPFFRKASSAAALASDAAKLRARRDDLVLQLNDANATVTAKSQAARELLLADKVDHAALGKTEDSIRAAETTVATRANALAEVDRQIAKIEAKIADLANEGQRKETASQIEAIRGEVGPAGAHLIDALLNAAGVAERAGLFVNDAGGLRIALERFASDLPAAFELVENLLGSHAKAVLAGNAPAALGKQYVATAPLAPEPTKRVFALAPLRCPSRDGEKLTARYQDFDAPVAYAEKALALGYALDPADQRTRRLRTGFVTAPLAVHCVNLGDENLEPFRPIYGADQHKVDARFEERVGGTQSWVRGAR
jgi:hypothetical protein